MSPLWRFGHPISPANPVIVPSSFPCRPGSSTLIEDHFKASTEKQAHHGTAKQPTKGGRPGVIIDILPDVALLEIFDFYMKAGFDPLDPDVYDEVDYYGGVFDREKAITAWHALVHVCRNWRNIVFGSPLRLDLRLYCIPHRTPVKETVDVWPLLPIIVWDDCALMQRSHASGYNKKWVDNIVAVFEYNDRVCEVDLVNLRSWQLEKVLAVMQQPFPALTRLRLRGFEAPVVPASFLGGSAPLLRSLWLDSIPFPGLTNLLLSATHPVELYQFKIPHSGYISPETIVTGLSVLTRLAILHIQFKSPQSCPDRKSRRPPPQTRSLLPVLTQWVFEGVVEYLEDFVARIDVPLLNDLKIAFFHQLILDTP